MSLTSQLKNPDSVIRSFMSEVFHVPGGMADRWRKRRPNDSLGTCVRAPDGVHPPYSILGQAIDHRLRFSMASAIEPTESVRQGMQIAMGPGSDAVKQWVRVVEALCGELAKLLQEHQPWNRDQPIGLPAAVEERLMRMCYVMSLFEALYRNPSAKLPESWMPGDGGAVELDTLLNSVPDYCISDLTAQIRLAGNGLEVLRSLTTPQEVLHGPTFIGSPHVGGADADLIAGGTLIDIKSSSRASSVGRAEFYQLLGYVLLDYDDAYGITHAGFYLSRYGACITWEVDRLLEALGAGAALGDLRHELARRHEEAHQLQMAADERRFRERFPADLAEKLIERMHRRQR